MTADDLAIREGEAFVIWRRALSRLEEETELIMTPYERNLDFWRQLWRCTERCELIVQILDARDPEFYRCHDLERCVKEQSGQNFSAPDDAPDGAPGGRAKRHLLLLNKADFLTADLRQRWAAYLKNSGTEAVFFSAARELHRQQRLVTSGGTESASTVSVPKQGEEEQGSSVGTMTTVIAHGPLGGDDADVLDCAQLLEEIQKRLPPLEADEDIGASATNGDACGRKRTVGFVGYPNVGKSSVINALYGARKVSMSRTPGKTKHLQTLELVGGLTLCDCPGLVFPSIVATKAHLAINGTAPLDELRDYIEPVSLIVHKVGLNRMLDMYGLGQSALRDGAVARGQDAAQFVASETETDEGAAHSFLAALALARHHHLKQQVPDETWAAKKTIRDYCSGSLLHCEPPPELGKEVPHAADTSGVARVPNTKPGEEVAHASVPSTKDDALAAAGESESDFSDLDAFLKGESKDDSFREKRPPKSKRRGR